MDIETQLLYIRPPCAADFNDLLALQSDPEVMHYIGNGVRDKETVLKGLAQAIAHQQKHGFSLGSVFDKNFGLFVGRAGLIHQEFNDEKDIEVAYAFHQTYWRRGYATEIVNALIVWGFNHLPIDKLIAIVHPHNQRSRQVLEKAGLHEVKRDEHGEKKIVYYQIERP